MKKKKLTLIAFIFSVIVFIFIVFSIAVFLKVNSNYKENAKKEFISEVTYLSKVTKDMIRKAENNIVNDAKLIANLDNVYYAFKEKKYILDKWDLKDDKIEMKVKNVTDLEYKKLVSNIINNMYQSGVGHLQGEKLISLYDENLNLVAYSYDFPENFLDKKEDSYIQTAIGGEERLSVDAAEIGIMEEKDAKIIIKGIAPIGKYVRFSNNKVWGIVVLGEYLNRAFLEEIKRLTNKDLILIIKDRISESTINDIDNINNMSLNINYDKKDFFYREIKLKNKIGGFSFFALKDYNENIIGYIGVGSVFNDCNFVYKKNIIDFIIFEIISLIIIITIFYFILKSQYIVFSKIMTKVEEIENGDYGKIIDIEARYELQKMINGINKLSEAVYNRESKLKELNLKLEEKILERTKELNKMVQQLKGIERLASIIYAEKNVDKAIEYILEGITQKNELGDNKKALFFVYNSDSCNLKANLKLDGINQEININTVNEDNIIVRSFLEKKIKICKGEFCIKIDGLCYMRDYIIFPIYYDKNSFGVLIIEYSDKLTDRDWEVLNIFTNNLAVYFENQRLREEDIKIGQLKTLLKISSGIVHELRTPITTIRGLSSMLMAKFSDNEKINQYVKVIIAETRRIDGMANDLLTYAEGKKDIDKFLENANINQIISEILHELEYDIKANNFQVIFETSDEVINYSVDKKKIRQAFFNIIKNAIEAAKGYNDILKIKVEKIFNEVKVEIIDNGVGIKDNIIDKIFEPLVTTKIQGTGLGLTVAKDIIERHGKSTINISRSNNKDEKTIVTVILRKY